MPLSYEQAVAEIEKLPNGGDLLSSLTEKVHSVNSEAQGLRNRYKTTESSLTKLKETLKSLELDPESDLTQQLQARLEKEKAGLKPESEIAEVKKSLEKYKKEIDTWKQTAEDAKKDSLMSKAKQAFSPKLGDHFGKAAQHILELATLKGQIVVRDEIPGVMYNDEFVPLNVESGLNAVDMLKKMYPELAITKQVTGSKKTNTSGASINEDKDEKIMTRAEFDKVSRSNPAEAMAFVKDGGTLVDE
jgi:hypothetical protein